MRSILLPVLFVLLIAPVASARSSYVSVSTLNLRSGPGSEHPVAVKLPINHEVTIIEEKSGYARVRVDVDGVVREGYVPSHFLRASKTTKDEAYRGMQKGPLKQRLDWGWRYWALNGRPDHGVIGSWLSEAAFEGKVNVVAPFFQLWRSHEPVLPAFALPAVDDKGPKVFAFREFRRSSYDIGTQPGGGHNFSSKQLGLPRSGLAIWMLPQNGPAKKVWLTSLRVSKWEGYYESSQIMWTIKGDTNGALAFSFSQEPPSGWLDNLSPKLSRNAAMNPAVSRLKKEGVDIANCHNGVSMFEAGRSWIAFCVKVTDVTQKKELGVRSFRYVHWVIEVDSNGMTKVMEHKEQPGNNYWEPIPTGLIGARDINNDGVIDLVWIDGCGSQVFTSNGLSVTSAGHCTC